MSWYVLVLFWIGFFALIENKAKLNRVTSVGDVEEQRYSFVAALIVIAPIIMMAATRDFNLGDTYVYSRTFNNKVPSLMDGLMPYLDTVSKDKGFYFFSSLIKIFITKDVVVYFWIIASIQGLLLLRFFRKYSCCYLMSIFLFVASTDYISWMFNGMRQFLAVLIVLTAVPQILNKKYIVSIIIIIFASFFHQTALLMIPILFVTVGDAWNRRSLIFIVVVIASIVFVNQFTDILNDSLAGTQYENVVSDYKSANDSGTNIIRVIIYCIPAILSFFYRSQINNSGSDIIKLSANMSIVSAGLYLISMVTSGIFIGRLPIYCSLFGYILLPWIFFKILQGHYRRYIVVVMIISYLIFYYYQMSVKWQLF